MRIALINEAWPPLVNGVVTTWTQMVRRLRAWGHQVGIIHPAMFHTIPCPGYPEIRLGIRARKRMHRYLAEIEPDVVHIATEGPLGSAARRWCLGEQVPFTSSYHSQFPEYLEKYIRLPARFSYPYLQRFHAPARQTLVPTPSMQQRLQENGFQHVVVWSRGVDADRFRPRGDRRDAFAGLPRPIFLCAGRVAHEKNIPAFLSLDLPGTKVVMGGGPILAKLSRRFPNAVFTGYQGDEQFAWMMACADVKVFPSRTDTFGLVQIEAMACGVPVAAYPVAGPIDIIRNRQGGVLSEDLREAALDALTLDKNAARQTALTYSWDDCARQLLGYLHPRTHPAGQTSSTADPATKPLLETANP